MLRRMPWKRLLYTLCFFWFCLIDQRVKTGTGLDGAIETFRNSMGIVMACIILSHYKWGDYRRRKVPCLIWSGLSIVGGVCALIWGWDHVYFWNQWAVLVLDVILFGFVLIHTFLETVVDKKRPDLHKALSVLWVAMMLYMIISRSNYIWPLAYLLLFGCFYLTDYSREEQRDLVEGILNGIILAFFILQGLCFVFRPFDNWIRRYMGIYSNSNLNALFYLEVLAAVLVKLLLAYRRQAGRWVKVFYWTGAGTLLSFLFLTIGRTAWLVAFVLCVFFLIFLNCFQAYRRFFRNGLLLVLCFVLTFPLCFGAVRYFPPLFHHPVWFWGEWSEDKVHSWDPWDSKKYVDLDEFLDEALGRVTDTVENLFEHSPFLMTVRAAETTLEEEPDLREQNAVLAVEEGMDSLLARSTIYKHYFSRLNLLGHPYEEQGFQMTKDYWIGHAHNIFLQFGTDFGIPVMLAFLAMGLWSVAIYWKRIRRDKSVSDVAWFFFVLIPLLFGMLEYSWGVGSLSMTMLFVAWKWALGSGNICISGDNML